MTKKKQKKLNKQTNKQIHTAERTSTNAFVKIIILKTFSFARRSRHYVYGDRLPRATFRQKALSRVGTGEGPRRRRSRCPDGPTRRPAPALARSSEKRVPVRRFPVTAAGSDGTRSHVIVLSIHVRCVSRTRRYRSRRDVRRPGRTTVESAVVAEIFFFRPYKLFLFPPPLPYFSQFCTKVGIVSRPFWFFRRSVLESDRLLRDTRR